MKKKKKQHTEGTGILVLLSSWMPMSVSTTYSLTHPYFSPFFVSYIVSPTLSYILTNTTLASSIFMIHVTTFMKSTSLHFLPILMAITCERPKNSYFPQRLLLLPIPSCPIPSHPISSPDMTCNYFNIIFIFFGSLVSQISLPPRRGLPSFHAGIIFPSSILVL